MTDGNPFLFALGICLGFWSSVAAVLMFAYSCGVL